MIQLTNTGNRAGAVRLALAGAALMLLTGCATPQAEQPLQGEAAAPDPLNPQLRAAGTAVYQASCAACHDGGLGHAPNRSALALLSPEDILQSLTSGVMQEQGSTLSTEEKMAVAQVVANRPLGNVQTANDVLMCSGEAARFDWSAPPVFQGWGLDAGNAHFIDTQTAGLGRKDVARLRLKWAFAFPGAIDARSQPALAGGSIFVGGANGTFYALDEDTGCARWSFEAASGVRTGAVVSSWEAGDDQATPLVYFGDNTGNLYAVEAATGTPVWQRRADAHPQTLLTGTPALHGDTLYVPVSSGEEGPAALPTYECCTFRGSLLAVNSRTGEDRWRQYMVDEPVPQGENSEGTIRRGPSGVAIWSAPLIDAERGLVYVATGDNYSQPATDLSDAIVAMDMTSGTIRWSSQVTQGDSWNVACWAGASGPNCPEDAGPDFDFGSAPVIAEGSDGKTYLLAGQKSGIAYAFDPDTGEQLWQNQVGRGGELGGIHFGIAAGNGRLYVPVSDLENGAVYDEPGRPGLYAIDIASGDLLWSAPAPNPCGDKQFCQPAYSSAITVTPELVVAGNTDGHLRILDTRSGALLWDMDTDIPFLTVNGTMGHGGSMSGGTAPIVRNGTIIVNSGYAFLGKLPGNVLLVFEAE
ncbi:PQQ-binding-like beta-propeller repeat protein [Alteraurantiacibacter aestuarii]|uniref:outer membrane protein assembly factor BamB family protein n=1 Tax=Alteraurantiacibacter aestuarii TaxID=650004 RepID=UPI0031D9C9D4